LRETDGVTSAFLHPFAKPAANDFLRIVRGEGAAIFDDQGKRYVDGMASLWYCSIGYGRTEIADAAADQMRTLAAYQCFDRFTNDPADRLAERISGLVAPAMGAGSRVFFTSGGSEAVDSAIKLVRAAQVQRGYQERTIVISRAPSYHGVTYGGMTLTGLPLNAAGFGPGVGDAVQVPKDDLDAVRAVFEDNPGRVAAVFAEPVIGAGGVYPPEPGYLKGLRALCDEHDAYLVLDEVICGFGRLGRWFAGEYYDVRADLTTFAKAVTSGYVPLGGVIVGRRVADALEADPAYLLRHGFTYSGHPTACAAGLAVLDVLEQEGLVQRATAVGKRLEAGLRALEADSLVAQVRGDGAVWAVALPPGQDPIAARDRILEAGAVVRPIAPDTLAMCPPLMISDDDLDTLLAAVRAGLVG
jgi:adenosylmethionine-8-amino-7-oxononanoate aminotransferase